MTTCSSARCTSIPAQGWFPHFLGFADERGAGDGHGLQPQPADRARAPATTSGSRAVHDLAEEARRFSPTALVVSLGVDAAEADPESPLKVTEAGFARAGRALATLGVPTVFVQEGGYDLEHLGPLVLAVLRGFEDASCPERRSAEEQR